MIAGLLASYKIRLKDSSTKNLSKERFFVLLSFFGFWGIDETFFLQSAERGGGDVCLDLLPVDDEGALRDVWLEDFASLSLRERDVVAVHFTFAGDFADSHVISPSRC